MIRSITTLFIAIVSTQLYAQIDSSSINPTIRGQASLNINDFDKTANAPSIGNLNFFNVPKSLGPLNLADEPMVTRGGQNIYRNAAPAVAKVFHDEGGGSGVIKDIPANTKVMGYPSIEFKEFIKKWKSNE